MTEEENKPTPEAEYIPFGDEWHNEVMQLDKDTIVRLYRAALIRIINVEDKLSKYYD